MLEYGTQSERFIMPPDRWAAFNRPCSILSTLLTTCTFFAGVREGLLVTGHFNVPSSVFDSSVQEINGARNLDQLHIVFAGEEWYTNFTHERGLPAYEDYLKNAQAMTGKIQERLSPRYVMSYRYETAAEGVVGFDGRSIGFALAPVG